MTQVDMAVLLDEPETTYARYERGESKVDYQKLLKFAEKLNVPVSEFLPEIATFHNTGNDNAQGGGGLVFGNSNQYFYYYGDSAVEKAFFKENKQLKEENEELKKKLSELEEKLETVLGRL